MVGRTLADVSSHAWTTRVVGHLWDLILNVGSWHGWFTGITSSDGLLLVPSDPGVLTAFSN